MSDGIIEVRSLNCNSDEKLCQSLHNLNYSFLALQTHSLTSPMTAIGVSPVA